MQQAAEKPPTGRDCDEPRLPGALIGQATLGTQNCDTTYYERKRCHPVHSKTPDALADTSVSMDFCTLRCPTSLGRRCWGWGAGVKVASGCPKSQVSKMTREAPWPVAAARCRPPCTTTRSPPHTPCATAARPRHLVLLCGDRLLHPLSVPIVTFALHRSIPSILPPRANLRHRPAGSCTGYNTHPLHTPWLHLGAGERASRPLRFYSASSSSSPLPPPLRLQS